MKKRIRIVSIMMMALLVVSQVSFAATPAEGRVLREDEEYTIVSSYSFITLLNSCPHDYTEIRVGDIIAESCTDITYNYVESCVRCGQKLKGGTIVIPRETVQHDIRTYSVMHLRDQHTYENRCSRCGYARSSFTVPCGGPPCPGLLSV